MKSLVEEDILALIKKDATKDYEEYWDCEDFYCHECPAKIDGKTPDNYYGTCCCLDAMHLNLIERTMKVMEDHNDNTK